MNIYYKFLNSISILLIGENGFSEKKKQLRRVGFALTMALSAIEMCCLETNIRAPVYCKVSPCFPASYGDDVHFHLMLLAIQAHICALILYNVSYCTYTHTQKYCLLTNSFSQFTYVFHKFLYSVRINTICPITFCLEIRTNY